MKISLDLHDFSILNNRLDLLLKFKEHYPQAKISLFTIPYDFMFEKQVDARILRSDTLKHVKKNLNWLQIIPHGLTHMPNEFENCDKTTFDLVIQSIDEVFRKDGIPYEKGFAAPQWLWNQDVVDGLDKIGWWGAVDRNQPDMLRTKKYYVYSHSLDEPFWESSSEIIKIHGHIDGHSKNDLEMCFTNLFRLPSDTEFHFVTDFIDEKDNGQTA